MSLLFPFLLYLQLIHKNTEIPAILITILLGQHKEEPSYPQPDPLVRLILAWTLWGFLEVLKLNVWRLKF